MKGVSLIKVFSATKARARDELGDRISEWIAANPQATVLRTTVLASSDRQFHCLSIVLLCST